MRGQVAIDPNAVPEPPHRRNPLVVAVLGVVISFIVFMWVYAFLFADDDGINRIEDRAWSQRAEATCAAAKASLLGLADYRTLEEVGDDALALRADIVEQTNVILGDMVATLAADRPVGEKSEQVIPRWIADYETYVADRVAYVDQLRRGDGSVFSETQINGSPISNFLGDVARQNEMPSCQAPLDLAV